jgi:hypothetical protein
MFPSELESASYFAERLTTEQRTCIEKSSDTAYGVGHVIAGIPYPLT